MTNNIIIRENRTTIIIEGFSAASERSLRTGI